MAMTQLPREMIRQILLCLDPVDRINSSSTCRDWFEEVSSAELLEDVWLSVCGGDMATVVPILMNSPRQYRNLRILGAELTAHSLELWAKIGKHLHRLELIECKLESDVFLSILRHCPKLESLELQGYSEGSAYELTFPQGTRFDEIRQSLPKVSILTADFDITEEIIGNLLQLMPEVTRLTLKTKSTPTNFVYPMPPNVMPSLSGTEQLLTELDIPIPAIPDDDLLVIIKTHAGTLQGLRVHCARSSDEVYYAFSECTKLRYLCLEVAFGLQDGHLEKIVQNIPALETLDVSISFFTDVGLAHLNALKRLKRLTLFCCLNLSSDALCNLARVQTLQHLDLEQTRFNNEGIQSLATLTDLRTLILGTEVNSESMDIICESFRRLETLILSDCSALYHEDGVKLCRLMNLKQLELGRAFRFTDQTLIEGIRSPSIDLLCVDGSPVSDAGLVTVVAFCKRLRYLELSETPQITDAGLANALRYMPRLESLSLQRCTSLTDESLRHVESICHKLINFKISECPVSEEGVAQFRSRRPFVYVGFTPMFLYPLFVTT